MGKRIENTKFTTKHVSRLGYQSTDTHTTYTDEHRHRHADTKTHNTYGQMWCCYNTIMQNSQRRYKIAEILECRWEMFKTRLVDKTETLQNI